MSERDLEKYESLAEQRIREAQENGEFDDLPRMGKPFQDLGGAYDDQWWVKKWMKREGHFRKTLWSVV